MKFKDGKIFSAYVRSKLHSGYITQVQWDKTQNSILQAKRGLDELQDKLTSISKMAQ